MASTDFLDGRSHDKQTKMDESFLPSSSELIAHSHSETATKLLQQALSINLRVDK